jgi:Lamin Tail Domain
MDRSSVRMRTTVVAGLLVVMFAVPACTKQHPGDFKIDLIHYKQGTRLNNEYIVIKNTSTKNRSLTHFAVVDPNAGERYTFPVTRLKPGYIVTLHTGHGRNRPGHRYWDRNAPVWNNHGDTAWLVNPEGKRISTCHYSGGGSTVNC